MRQLIDWRATKKQAYFRSQIRISHLIEFKISIGDIRCDYYTVNDHTDYLS